MTKFIKIAEEFSITLPAGHDIKQGRVDLEKAYFEFVYKNSRYNQSRAAKLLGLSRGCFRTKLFEHFGDKYILTRDGK